MISLDYVLEVIEIDEIYVKLQGDEIVLWLACLMILRINIVVDFVYW
jgi:transposase-like protein